MPLFGLFGSDDEESEETEKEQTVLGLAAPRVEVIGAVHASGEAYVTVKRQHGQGGDEPISVRGSVHHSGHTDLTVEEVLDFDPDHLPEPADSPTNFTRYVQSRYDNHGAVHSPGNNDVHIEELVIVPPETAGSMRPSGEPRVFKALGEAGYDCYDEINLEGSVHERGTVNVMIDDLYVYPKSML